jgi:hypothetical protein
MSSFPCETVVASMNEKPVCSATQDEPAERHVNRSINCAGFAMKRSAVAVPDALICP